VTRWWPSPRTDMPHGAWTHAIAAESAVISAPAGAALGQDGAICLPTNEALNV
jgi:hypothetical protein